MIEQERAGVHAACLKIVVRVPLQVAALGGGKTEAGDQWRQMACLGHEGNASKLHSAGEDVSAAGHHRAAKCGIEEIFLGQFPSDNFPGLGLMFTGLVVNERRVLPRSAWRRG